MMQMDYKPNEREGLCEGQHGVQACVLAAIASTPVDMLQCRTLPIKQPTAYEAPRTCANTIYIMPLPADCMLSQHSRLAATVAHTHL